MKMDGNSQGMLVFGVVAIVISVIVFVVAVECIEGTTNRMTLVEVYENGDGLWVDEDSGERKIYTTEDCQVGETRDVHEEGLSVFGLISLLLISVVILVVGLIGIRKSIKGNLEKFIEENP